MMEDSGQIPDDMTGQIYLTPVSNIDTSKEQTHLGYVTADALPQGTIQMDQLGNSQSVTLLQIADESFNPTSQVQQLYQLVPQNCNDQQIIIDQEAQPAISSTISNSTNTSMLTQLSPAAATLADGQISVIENNGQQYFIVPNFLTLAGDQQISFQGQGADEPSLLRILPTDATDIPSAEPAAAQTVFLPAAASMLAPQPPKQVLNFSNVPKELPLTPIAPDISLPRQPPSTLQFHDSTPGVPKKTTTITSGQLQMLDIIPSFFQRTVHQQSEMAGAKFCKQCKYEAKSVEDMQQHLVKHKNDLNVKKKNEPPRKRKTRRKKKAQMIRTVATKDTEFPPTCPVCEERLKTAAQHRKHIKWHKNDKAHRCNECGESFNKEHNLLLHKSIHNRLTSDSGLDKYECPDCTKVFNRMASLKMHLLLHAEEETFLCKECGDEFATEDDLGHHTLEHINEIARHVQDKTKAVSFIMDNPNTAPGSAITVNIDDIPDNFEDSLAQIQGLTASKQAKQPPNHGVTPHKCAECEKYFQKKSQLTRHMLIHSGKHGLTPHKCAECEKCFQKKSQLTRHMLIHNGEPGVTPHKCAECEKYFQKKSQLTRHMLIHTGEKPHKCPTCGKAFNQKVAMQQHMMVHTNEKKFTCPHCPQTYRQRGNLNLHIKRVHLIQPTDSKAFSCQLCPCIFKKLGSLNAHVTKYHSDQSFMVGKESTNNLKEAAEKGTPQDDDLQKFLSVFDKPDSNLLMAPENNQQQDSDILHRALEDCVGDSALATESNTSKGTFPGLVSTSVVMQSAPFEIQNMELQQTIDANIQPDFDMQSDNATRAQQSCETVGISVCETLVNLEAFQSASSTSITSNPVSMSTVMVGQHTAVAGPANSAPGNEMRDGNGIKIKFIKGIRHHICPYCQKEFRKPSDLTRHIRIHTMERPFRCKHCSRAFTVKSSLTSHIRSHLGIKPYRCEVCQKMFTTNSSLKIHIRLHTGAKPFGCPYCEKKFRTNGQRTNHICSHFKSSRTHRPQRPIKKKPSADFSHVKMLPPMILASNGRIGFHKKDASGSEENADKPFKCELCGKGFLKQSCLTRHGRSHSGERPYECTTCKRKFISNGCLRAHLKTHANSGKFICSTCSQAFSTKGSLKRHAITHTKSRPFMCPYCKKMFKTSGACKKHIKIHRPDIALMQNTNPKTFQPNTVTTQPEPTSLTALLDAETTISGMPTIEETINSTFMASIQDHDMSVGDSTLKQIDPNMVQNIRNLSSPPGLVADQPPQTFLLSSSMPDHQQATEQSLPQVPQQLSLEDLAVLSVNPMMVNPDNAQDPTDLTLFELAMPTSETSGLTVVGQPSYVDSLPLLEGISTEPQIPVPVTHSTIVDTPLASSSGIRQTPLKKVKAPKRKKYHGGKLIKVNLNKMYQCTGCEAVFTPDDFEEHNAALRNDSADVPFLCDFCCHCFTSGEHYKSHVEFHSVVEDALVYKCSKCGLGFVNKHIQEEHQNSHCREHVRHTQQKSKSKLSATAGLQRPINSNKIRSNFIRLTDEQSRILSQTNPNLHMTVSERVLLSAVAEKDRVIERVDEKRGRYKPMEVNGPKHKHVCPHCPKSFYKQNDLVRHIRTHTGEKPFQCKTCGKHFTVKSYLITHEKMHSGVKQFHCHICDLMYASKTSLKVHMRLHTGGLPFKCPHCDRRFRTSGHRKNHIASHFRQNTAPSGPKKRGRQAKANTSNEQQHLNPDQGDFLLSDVTLTLPEGLLQESDGLHLQWNGQTLQLVNAGKGSLENMTLQIDQAALQQALGSPPVTTSQDIMRTYTRPVTTGPSPNLVIQPITLPAESNSSGAQELNVAVPASLASITQLLFQSATAGHDTKDAQANTAEMADPAHGQQRHKDLTLALAGDDLTAQGIIAGDNVQPFNFELLGAEDIQSDHNQPFS